MFARVCQQRESVILPEIFRFLERSSSYTQESDDMHSFGNSFRPENNLGFVSEPQQLLPKCHGTAESLSGDKTSGVGTHSLSVDDTCLDFGLHQAAREGAVAVLKTKLQEIVEKGEDVLRVIDFKDADGFTPLHHAAKCNRKDALVLLMDNGAYLDARGEDENTPLHLAAK